MIRRPPRSTLFPYTTPSDLHRPAKHRCERYLPERSESTAFRARRTPGLPWKGDRKSTRLNSSHQIISYAVFCLKKKILYTKIRDKPEVTLHTHHIMQYVCSR